MIFSSPLIREPVTPSGGEENLTKDQVAITVILCVEKATAFRLLLLKKSSVWTQKLEKNSTPAVWKEGRPF
jgi:hypothetical protein